MRVSSLCPMRRLACTTALSGLASLALPALPAAPPLPSGGAPTTGACATAAAGALPLAYWGPPALLGAHPGLTCARRFLSVERSETPNPECMRFYSMELSFLGAGQSMDMPNAGHAYKSPLAEALFGIEGVKAVYFADEYMTITKDAGADWDAVAPLVSEALIAFAESGVNILSEDGERDVVVDDTDTEPQLWDDEVILAIKELLAARIRPMLRGDGGNCRFSGFDDGVVHLLLEGACKSCPSSGATLKHGIERMLMHWIPEVLEVVEVDEDFYYDYKRSQQEAKREYEKAHGGGTGGEDEGVVDVPPPPPPA